MSKNTVKNCRLGAVGGAAVLEGVMMKSKEDLAVAVRKEDGTITVHKEKVTSLRTKYKFLNLPIVRGVVGMIESFMQSFKALNISAEAYGLEEEEPGKFEKWLNKHFGKSIVDIVMVIATILGVALSVGLFILLPSAITKGIDNLTGENLGYFKNVVEGVIKILIFLGYLWVVSLLKDIRRTFEYHGAEHKSIFCYEAGEELTVENVKKFKRFHPRCGTSFMFVILIISILIFSLPFVPWDNILLRMLIKLPLLPVVVGIGFEFIMVAGKHDNALTRTLSAPGLWIQRITTREPDDEQIEIAIAAIKSALPEVFPDFTVENKAEECAEEAVDTENTPNAENE